MLFCIRSHGPVCCFCISLHIRREWLDFGYVSLGGSPKPSWLPVSAVPFLTMLLMQLSTWYDEGKLAVILSLIQTCNMFQIFRQRLAWCCEKTPQTDFQKNQVVLRCHMQFRVLRSVTRNITGGYWIATVWDMTCPVNLVLFILQFWLGQGHWGLCSTVVE